MVIKIVNEELIRLMGSDTTEIALKPTNEITVITLRTKHRPADPVAKDN